MRCVGSRDGAPCPAGFEVDLLAPEAYDRLERLHLDHEQDVRIACDLWQRALPATAPAAWDDGVDGGLLCHLLFGVDDSAARGPPYESRARQRSVPAPRAQRAYPSPAGMSPRSDAQRIRCWWG